MSHLVTICSPNSHRFTVKQLFVYRLRACIQLHDVSYSLPHPYMLLKPHNRQYAHNAHEHSKLANKCWNG